MYEFLRAMTVVIFLILSIIPATFAVLAFIAGGIALIFAALLFWVATTLLD